MEHDLSRCLHRLTGRLDRAADAFLRAQAGVSYRRFLALYHVGLEGADTQRALADARSSRLFSDVVVYEPGVSISGSIAPVGVAEHVLRHLREHEPTHGTGAQTCAPLN